MSLHRLLGFDAAVPDPDTLSAYYAELGLSGDASSGFTGSDGGASVTLAEGPFRRLDSVSVGCEDESDLAAIAGRVEAGGAVARIADGVLAVVDPATRVRFEVRVADATPVTFLWLTRSTFHGACQRLSARRLVLYAGQPLGEPLTQRGPFVAGVPSEITDFNRRFRADEFTSMSELVKGLSGEVRAPTPSR